MTSVRFESEVARQAGKAALAAATAASTSATEAKSTCLVSCAGRRVVDRPLAPGRAGDESAADPVADASRGRGVPACGVGFCDLCHRDRPRAWSVLTILAHRRVARS